MIILKKKKISKTEPATTNNERFPPPKGDFVNTKIIESRVSSKFPEQKTLIFLFFSPGLTYFFPD